MKRIDIYLGDTKDGIDYPEDIKTIKSCIPELKYVSDARVQEMYRDYSDQMYSAGWMNLGYEILAFKIWLETDTGEIDD